MRLDFNVLWVDDQPDRVKSQIAAIKRKMVEEGFEFAPRLCKSMDEVGDAISDNVFADEIDLILVDWDLGNEVVGQDAISEIRKTVQYKDVVFYSAQTTPEDLRKAVFDKRLEGIYCASRAQLVEEVMGVFESLVKKVLDLDHTRGIVMGATSDIDYLVNQCLMIVVDRHLDVAGKAKLFKDALGYVQVRIDDLSKKAQALEGATTLDEFFEAHMILTANDRLRILGGLLKIPKLSSHKEYRTAVTKYQQQVVPDRNLLGHMVLIPEGKPNAVTDSGGKPISLKKTRELRCLILDLRNQFRQLHAALQSMAAPSSGLPPSTDTK
jgi:hypothetical protein